MEPAEQKSTPWLTGRLAESGYWPARAAMKLAEGRYADVVRICRDNLDDTIPPLSGRVVYASALLRSGQTDSAADEFRRVLASDPDHLVALKAMGDAAYANNDAAGAMSYYRRVLEIDPCCRGLKSELELRPGRVTRTITLSRGSETDETLPGRALRAIPFYTETMGDLYLAQGYPRLAAEVFRRVHEQNHSPRVQEKLAQAEANIKEKER
jgi:predicted Zn-dependent protease